MIAIDHVGEYVWTSSTVLPGPPGGWAMTYRKMGVAELIDVVDRLVAVPGGYAEQFSFTVKSFSPGAAVAVTTSKAEGTADPIIPTGGAG